DNLPLFNVCFYIRDDSIPTIFIDVVGLIFKLWASRIDLYFDLEVYSAFSTVITTLSFSRNRYGFYIANTDFRRELHTHLVYFNDYQQISRIYLQFARACGINNQDLAMEKPVLKDEHLAEFSRTLGKNKLAQDIPYIIVNPNASDLLLERRWPMEYFVSLLESLAQNWPHPIFILGSEDERNYSRVLLEKLSDKAKQNVFDLAGEISFGAAMVFINKARLVITNDSGLYHVAASFKVAIISLWGPGRPEHYADTDSKEDSFVFYSSGIYCSPCIYRTDFPPCRGNNVCMKSISPKEVYRKASQLLKVDALADTSEMERIYEAQKNKKFDIIIKHPGY
ncbi:MAG: glycosyltransferase family 9 protein, partial [Candidatus Omnitrophica bacterium]|nr:glycosyltransferase family 9 protein [Candidatus Omnitrophota bacterium]